MCGIFGIQADKPADELKKTVYSMANILDHRGPDDRGFYFDKESGLALGMTRLSIVDRKYGKQPIFNEDNSLVLILNGEIYNHNELRNKLKSKGHFFRTGSDAEVVLHLYEEEKEKSFGRLNGMFAFCIYDLKRKETVLARDRFGVKPLLYTEKNGFAFASEMKAFHAISDLSFSLNTQSVADYFSFWYVPSPNCIVNEVKKLDAAHFMVLKDKKILKIERYWFPNYEIIYNRSYQELKEEYLRLMTQAVSRQLQGEVPVGLFLSGGLDSGVIAATLSEKLGKSLHSFSVGFESASYDETPLIQATSKSFRTNHHHIYATGNLISLVEHVAYFQDQPLGFTSYPYYQICDHAKNFVTVLLSGDGGDELFGGYDTYCGHSFLQKYRVLPPVLRRGLFDIINAVLPYSFSKRGFDIQLRKFLEAGTYSPERSHVSWREIFSPKEKEKLLIYQNIDYDPYARVAPWLTDARIKNIENRFMFYDLSQFLMEAGLSLADRMGMAHSLEIRVPFLDNDLFDFSASLPIKWKFKGLRTKVLMREVLADVLPKTVVDAPKLGFAPPIAEWIFGPLNEYFYDLLHSRDIRESGVINTEYALKVLDDHIARKQDNSRRLMTLFGFSTWYQQFYLRQSSHAKHSDGNCSYNNGRYCNITGQDDSEI